MAVAVPSTRRPTISLPHASRPRSRTKETEITPHGIPSLLYYSTTLHGFIILLEKTNCDHLASDRVSKDMLQSANYDKATDIILQGEECRCRVSKFAFAEVCPTLEEQVCPDKQV